MAGLKRYTVNVRSGRSDVETIMKLTPEEADRLGAVEYEKPKAKQAAPANKGRGAANKDGGAAASKK